MSQMRSNNCGFSATEKSRQVTRTSKREKDETLKGKENKFLALFRLLLSVFPENNYFDSGSRKMEIIVRGPNLPSSLSFTPFSLLCQNVRVGSNFTRHSFQRFQTGNVLIRRPPGKFGGKNLWQKKLIPYPLKSPGFSFSYL